MGHRYSREERRQIEHLTADGLTSREIATRLNRSEAGIRNIRYRLNLKTETEGEIRSLLERKKEMVAQIGELGKIKALRSGDIKSLDEKKEHYEKLLHSEEESIRKKIEDKLIMLKLEKPELFYITDAEQIAKLGALVLKWFLS